MKAAEEKIAFAGRAQKPHQARDLHHQGEPHLRSDLRRPRSKDGKPVGNGDPSLTMYGEAVTPNQHKLALQFGVLDNFFDSGEVSGDGHVWSTAAIGTDYLEKTWQQNYRGGQRTYDYEGVVAEGYPLLQKIPDVNEPASGYLWGNLAAHGKSYYHFGEFISTKFCDEVETANPQQGPMIAGHTAPARPSIPARSCPPSGAAAKTSGPGRFR